MPCIAEAPQLLALKQAGVRIDAIAIRDRPADVADFLKRYGDPYAAIGDDGDSRVQLSLGSSGVPETFFIDGRGRIRRQHVGDIRADDVPEVLRTLEAHQVKRLLLALALLAAPALADPTRPRPNSPTPNFAIPRRRRRPAR